MQILSEVIQIMIDGLEITSKISELEAFLSCADKSPSGGGNM